MTPTRTSEDWSQFLVEDLGHLARISGWPNGCTWSIHLWCRQDTYFGGINVRAEPRPASMITCLRCLWAP